MTRERPQRISVYICLSNSSNSHASTPRLQIQPPSSPSPDLPALPLSCSQRISSRADPFPAIRQWRTSSPRVRGLCIRRRSRRSHPPFQSPRTDRKLYTAPARTASPPPPASTPRPGRRVASPWLGRGRCLDGGSCAPLLRAARSTVRMGLEACWRCVGRRLCG